MIEFRQKTFAEYDAMRSLYVKLNKDFNNKGRVKTINVSSLPSLLTGNNVIVERFVISTSFMSRDKYRMYLKVGAKAKMPDKFRLPSTTRTKEAGVSLEFGTGSGGGNNNNNNGGNNTQKNHSYIEQGYSLYDEKYFADFAAKSGIRFNIKPQYDSTTILGETLEYSLKDRSIVLEFYSLDDAVEALNILPFGINYNVYLLV